MDTEANPIKDAALAYRERGFRIIPLHPIDADGACTCWKRGDCASSGKHPIENEWQTGGQLNDSQINVWFGGGDRLVRNIGIVTGPDSGIFVLDVDGEQGQQTLMDLINKHGAIPKTKMVKTGSGGYHFYFAYPDFKMGNSASTKLGKGLDTRGAGGYVVAPPSVSAKGTYFDVAVRGEDIVAAPGWLLDMLRPKERKATGGAAPDVAKPVPKVDSAEQQRLEGYTDGAVATEVGRLKELTDLGWDGPPWDITTYEVACNLIQLANAPWSSLIPKAAFDLVMEHAPRDPNFDDERVLAKYESAFRTVGDNEATYPPKPSSAFWITEDEEEAPLVDTPVPEAAPVGQPDTSIDDFMSDATAEDAIVITVPATLDGIPVAKGTLIPNYVELATVAAQGAEYDPKARVDVVVGDDVADLADLIRQPDANVGDPGNQIADIAPVDVWIERNLKSGTQTLLWAAVASIIRGVDTDAPVIVFKGGGPLLRLLARIVTPAVGPEPETLLAGPRFSTREHDGDQLVFEFGDEDIDLTPYTYEIIDKAVSSNDDIRAMSSNGGTGDALTELEDFRAAQISRGRLGLGSKTRSDHEEF